MSSSSGQSETQTPRVYRFRSIEHLLGKYQELRNQQIYFARPDELGDPRESERDIVWRSDETGWSNLLRNYLHALHQTYRSLQLTGYAVSLGPSDIDPSGRSRLLQSDSDRVVSETAWQAFWDDPDIRELFGTIGRDELAIRRNELFTYLHSAHPIAVASIELAHEQHDLPTVGTPPLLPRPAFTEHVFTDEYHLKLRSRIFEDDNSEFLSEKAWQLASGPSLKRKYDNRHANLGAYERNLSFVRHGFPRAFVTRLPTLLGPEWRTACFTRDCTNASMWSQYADGHKGACLMFRSRPWYGRQGIVLRHPLAHHWGELPGVHVKSGRLGLPFYDVKYMNTSQEVDFFRNLRALDDREVANLWHSDEDGAISISTLIDSVDRESDAFEPWPGDDYWFLYVRNAAIKSTDWEHEQETRLILRPARMTTPSARRPCSNSTSDPLKASYSESTPTMRRSSESWRSWTRSCLNAIGTTSASARRTMPTPRKASRTTSSC